MQASGLAGEVVAIVNTGDDFRHLGLHISPDIDTVLYTLSGRANTIQGWGREDESWAFLDAVRSLGGPDWFKLGDGDLALHVMRTDLLAHGNRLSEITANFARTWRIETAVLPMSDDSVATQLDTDHGVLEFQRYFVEHRCQPRVRAISFAGSENARPAPGVVDAIRSAEAVFIAPSNPYLSIDPILAVEQIGEALRRTSAPVVAVSPIVGGRAVKGPTIKLMTELGIETSNESIATHYGDVVDAMLHDARDAPPADLPARTTDTLMQTLDDKIRVAAEAIVLSRSLKAA
jgi:LPPG:FO 2-phospho-L-lactate transferase